MTHQLQNRFKMLSITFGAVFILSLFVNCSLIKTETYYENGILATASPIATQVGIDVFKSGGNSFDAAVAVGFTLAVVHPQAGNIGGGGFAVIRSGATGEIDALDFREKAPLAASEKMYLDSDENVIEGLSTKGAKAVGVPGTVAGLYALWEKNGSKEWSELVNYAAELADTGFIVDEHLEESLKKYNDSFDDFEQSASIFYPDGRQLKAGDRLIQKNLAKALYTISAEGPDGFYKGVIADSIAATMVEYGGLITSDDLAGYSVSWKEPIHVKFDSLDIYSMSPPSSGGIVVGQILKLIEPYDFSLYTVNSPEYINLFAEMSKLAFADRSKHLGDPDFYPVPLKRLLDDEYLKNRRELITIKQAKSAEEILPGGVLQQESDETTHFSICDKEGNIVSLTYTLNTSYGSKLMINGFGILLNNQMDDFSIKPGVQNYYGLIGGEANKIEPGKRMLSSMSPTIILKDKQPFLVLGSPGGSKIITVVTQAIINFSRFNLSSKETVRQPRFHHQWVPDLLYLEENQFAPDIQEQLRSYGYQLKERSAYSDLQLLYIDNSGLMTGASDPRNRGTCFGY